ncbi:S-adenosyl-L-methionine-dependent methyltransferase [Rhizoclosmatium globosum]|uniref:S-adenosyl-L-methionine-dependent methyltransferase n=1 Tax=Rhizoclosmatium globosum TaxID=329046 RepID=A0A1Y2CDK4_9FUNG|nr:S-adenosyl-L-methionine-dependent methyltransferase [Rhizoclosmatium globosum]|eukprot:ORY45129.1 S-adenosyl-L-methionine-dependent methyltransferase [Rhizoclosmatium globosum]
MTTQSFPPKFTQWLADNGVSIKDYEEQESIPRFIRVNPSHITETFAKELNTELTPVSWLPGLRFYSLDAKMKISGSKGYESGEIYGMDVSSGVAVHALSIDPEDHVLDLCCAPGDLQGNEDSVTGTVTGVDISKARIATCKNVLRKYKMRRFRLFDADGTTFNVHAPSRVGRWTRPTGQIAVPELDSDDDTAKGDQDTIVTIPSKRKDDTPNAPPTKKKAKVVPKVKPYLATKLVIGDPQIESPALLYDKVLVDAECTHDGSIAHLKKCDAVGWEKFEENFFDPVKMDALETLQRGLLSNGYRLLKPGGVLVYSTCSFSRRQNEGVVEWFLKENSNATLEPIPNAEKFPLAPSLDGNPTNMLRFSPSGSGTSGYLSRE